jgi:hypothetical protein
MQLMHSSSHPQANEANYKQGDVVVQTVKKYSPEYKEL